MCAWLGTHLERPLLSTSAVAGLFPGHMVLSKGLLVAQQTGCTVTLTEGRLRIAVTRPENEGLRLLLYLFAILWRKSRLRPLLGKG